MPGRREEADIADPDRGDIVDRNGDPLARTIDAWTIAVHPSKVIGDKLALAQRLALPDARADVRAIFRAAAVGEAVLLPAPQGIARAGRSGERDRRAGGWRSNASRNGSIRRPLLPPVLGFTDIDGHGAAGMERAFDKYLSDPATRGQPLTLSIDSRVQQALETRTRRCDDPLFGDRGRRRRDGRS